ncbi:(2Fe-2S)-binding protein [Blastococcus sp. SYSU D00922]
MAERLQDAVTAQVPGAAALGLVAPASAVLVPGATLADAGWTARQVRGAADARVAATVWWYSLSSVLLTPPLAGLVAGSPLSARLEDLSVAFSAGRPVAAVSGGRGGDLAADLRDSLAAVVTAVADAGGMRARPLWAIATDSLANRLLVLGQATGDVGRTTGLAAPLAAAVGPPLPVPRYEDVGGRRFVRRASCCLLDRMPGMPTCTSCPNRAPEERRRLLERLAGRG